MKKLHPQLRKTIHSVQSRNKPKPVTLAKVAVKK